jgi:hypothetical protein
VETSLSKATSGKVLTLLQCKLHLRPRKMVLLKIHHCLFTATTLSPCIFLIYVDDIIITAFAPAAITELLQLLSVDFTVKDLGAFTIFLGLKFSQSSRASFSPNAGIFWTY